jgi:hypothetical protein
MKEKNPDEQFYDGERYSSLTTGFLAQEVETAARQCNFTFSGVDAPKNDKDFYGLRYAEFVVPLVKAVQEQQMVIEQQKVALEATKSAVDELKSENAALQKQMEYLIREVTLLKEKPVFTLEKIQPSIPDNP